MANISKIKLPSGVTYDVVDNTSGYITSYIDTKNTAGSINSTSLLYLVGAMLQDENPQTYSNSNLFFDNGLSSRGEYQNYITDIHQTGVQIGSYIIDQNSGNENGVIIDSTGVSIYSNFGQVAISNLAAPVNNTDAANKKYVDDSISAISIPTKTSDLTNDSGFITSYTDEKLKWTTSTSSGTFYPLQSTISAATSTASTINSVNFYQYYNTAGGYRRLTLGNSTSYTSSGGAYGKIRLYGTGATYYGDINPGTIGANSLTANRTWTLPNATGTIALTSDITDAKKTAGATNSDSKLYLIGATSQGTSPHTYSNSNLFFNNGLNSTATHSEDNIITEIYQTSSTVGLRVTDEETFGHGIEVSATEVHLSATNSATGYVAVNDSGTVITGLITPTANTDAANKKYVDDNKGAQVQIVRW